MNAQAETQAKAPAIPIDQFPSRKPVPNPTAPRPSRSPNRPSRARPMAASRPNFALVRAKSSRNPFGCNTFVLNPHGLRILCRPQIDKVNQ